MPRRASPDRETVGFSLTGLQVILRSKWKPLFFEVLIPRAVPWHAFTSIPSGGVAARIAVNVLSARAKIISGLRISRASNAGWPGVGIPPGSRILFLHRPLARPNRNHKLMNPFFSQVCPGADAWES